MVQQITATDKFFSLALESLRRNVESNWFFPGQCNV